MAANNLFVSLSKSIYTFLVESRGSSGKSPVSYIKVISIEFDHRCVKFLIHAWSWSCCKFKPSDNSIYFCISVALQGCHLLTKAFSKLGNKIKGPSTWCFLAPSRRLAPESHRSVLWVLLYYSCPTSSTLIFRDRPPLFCDVIVVFICACSMVSVPISRYFLVFEVISRKLIHRPPLFSTLSCS